MKNIDKDDVLYEPVYTIGHAAKKLGVSVPTLRMYEQAGLIIPYRTETNRRLFSRHDIAHIEIIIDLIRNHHLNIEAIKRLVALTPCWRVINCPQKMRQKCRAYIEGMVPCWLLPETNCGQSKECCRTCEVYLSCPKILTEPISLIKTDAD